MQSRDFALVYINGKAHHITGDDLFLSLSDYLRYQSHLTGTKVVCAEGDCGACTVLVGQLFENSEFNYHSMNSCIQTMGLLDQTHVITVEGLGQSDNLHPIQKSMLQCHGAQCGFCTPGFICSMAAMVEDVKKQQQKIHLQRVKNHLTGNLCRCTGYESIIESALTLSQDPSLKDLAYLNELYPAKEMIAEMKKVSDLSLLMNSDSHGIFLPRTIEEAVKLKRAYPKLRLISGATDLGVQKNKGKIVYQQLMSLNNVKTAYDITDDGKALTIGAKVSLTNVEEATKNYFSEFSHLLHIFASPQIKHTGTLVGNLANASPIGDTIPFLNVANAEVVIASFDGTAITRRSVLVNDFIQGYKVLDLKEEELIEAIKIPKTNAHFKLYKTSLRRDLDISQVTVGIRFKFKNDDFNKKEFEDLEIAFGGMSARVERVPSIVSILKADFSPFGLEKAKLEVAKIFKPFTDVRASSEYRILVAENLLEKFFDEVNLQIISRANDSETQAMAKGI